MKIYVYLNLNLVKRGDIITTIYNQVDGKYSMLEGCLFHQCIEH